MRRYLFEGNIHSLPRKDFDVIIAGAGISGLFAALQLPEETSCALLAKGNLRLCNTYLAQGGVAAEFEDIECHIRDTLLAGSGTSDETMTRIMVEEGSSVISDLMNLGVLFDHDSQGRLKTTLEGGHSKKRILHCGGDATGKIILEKLVNAVFQKPNIQVFENHFLVDIITNEDQKVCGTLVYEKSPWYFYAPEVIVCTGGIGTLYQNTTNSEGATGDGIAAAMRAGAILRHMQFVQFHPTVFYDKVCGRSGFLISEALRGEGAILLNSKKEAFMQSRHHLKDLAPRDVVSQEIFRELKKSGTPFVFLDITSRSETFLKTRFPNIFRLCSENGINISKDLIPVTPAQHYIMGGIKINQNGETNVEGLFACGEAACSGVHGANRLASNSLLDCLVFSKRCAINLKLNSSRFSTQLSDHVSRIKTPLIVDTSKLMEILEKTVEENCGIIRNRKRLEIAADQIEMILNQLENASLKKVKHFEAYNMTLVAQEITKAAIKQTSNIGSHYSEK